MNNIDCDLFRYTGKSDLMTKIKAFRIPGFKFMYFFRKASSFKKYSVQALFFRIFYSRYFYKYGFQIELNTKIGAGFYIGHFGNVVISPHSVIGKNCNISHCVTIGKTNRGEKAGAPMIGNEVWIGTGTVIVGKIKIGNNVLIAPNSFVNFDVPDNSLVIGNPARIIHKEHATEGYINRKII